MLARKFTGSAETLFGFSRNHLVDANLKHAETLLSDWRAKKSGFPLEGSHRECPQHRAESYEATHNDSLACRKSSVPSDSIDSGRLGCELARVAWSCRIGPL